jgi:ubiquinone/menaquinone biosynthesis C-methylase UbiE
MGQQPRVCDYEGSTYKTDFWEGQGREYEDLAERIALKRLLPPTGHRLLDIGAGFGRLSQFYEGYDQVILLDYSRSLLRQAQERLGREGRILYVAASFYTMPFVPGAIDTAMMVRVIHHVAEVPRLLDEVARVLVEGGTYVLEFASKRHLKAMARHALGRQSWSPYDPDPVEFVEMNFDFHPTWMQERLAEAGFHVKHRRTVSHFRLPLLKRLVPPPALAKLDGLCQPTGAWWQLTPSVFLDCTLGDGPKATLSQDLFRCPACGATGLAESTEALDCPGCGRRWPIEDGIYNFKEPRPA